MPKQLSRRTVRLVLAALLAASSAHVLTSLYLQQDNTLEQNGRWVSPKLKLARPVVGAVAYTVSRNTLHRNRLNIGAWGGFQKLLYREAIALTEAKFNVYLGRQEYLSFIFQSTQEGFAAVRISARDGIDSAFLLGAADGEYTQRSTLSTPQFGAGRHHVTVSTDASSASVEIDGVSVGRLEVPGRRTGFVGFRSSGGDETWIDDVVLLRADAAPIRDDFRNHRDEWKIFLAVFAVVFGGLVALDAVFVRRQVEHPGFRIVGTGAVLLLLCLMPWAVDTFYLWNLYPTITMTEYLAGENPFESRADVVKRLKSARKPRRPGDRRILFLGSSQTWGAGAPSLEEAFVSRFEALLNRDAAGHHFECINLSVSGASGPALVRVYANQFLPWRPDVVVVNLGHNGKEFEDLRNALRRLVRMNRRKKIATVFVLEAASTEVNSQSGESHLPRLAKNHQVMREVAAELQIPVIDMHAFLAERANSGFLWWDRVHPTSFGHRLIAQRLFDEREHILPHVEFRSSGPPTAEH